MTTYSYTDPVGETFDIQPVRLVSGPALSVAVNDAACWIPLDQVDTLIAGVHAAARQAAEKPPRAGEHQPPAA